MDVSPLDEMDDAGLYKLLGDAWYAQLRPRQGESYFLPSSADVGLREFEAVLPVLTEALRQPYFHGSPARIASTLQVEASWNMPALVVATLARRRGLVGGSAARKFVEPKP